VYAPVDWSWESANVPSATTTDTAPVVPEMTTRTHEYAVRTGPLPWYHDAELGAKAVPALTAESAGNGRVVCGTSGRSAVEGKKRGA
jgi:hypothetical protein